MVWVDKNRQTIELDFVNLSKDPIIGSILDWLWIRIKLLYYHHLDSGPALAHYGISAKIFFIEIDSLGLLQTEIG